MIHYQLLATDMDGTLLNKNHEISHKNRESIRFAFSKGKQVVFCSGRCAAELRPYIEQFPEMRYAVTESGACVYDFWENIGMNRCSFDPMIAKCILEYAKGRDILIQAVIKDQGTIPVQALQRLEYYHLSQYQDFFKTLARHVEDVFTYCAEQNWKMDKICLYHSTISGRDKTASALSQLPVTMAFAEETGIEISPLGIDKSVGLSFLCDYLDIPMEQVIMVGDSFNDLGALEKAGLPVLVANARVEIRSRFSTMVANCDNSGVAEAIMSFLMR